MYSLKTNSQDAPPEKWWLGDDSSFPFAAKGPIFRGKLTVSSWEDMILFTQLHPVDFIKAHEYKKFFLPEHALGDFSTASARCTKDLLSDSLLRNPDYLSILSDSPLEMFVHESVGHVIL